MDIPKIKNKHFLRRAERAYMTLEGKTTPYGMRAWFARQAHVTPWTVTRWFDRAEISGHPASILEQVEARAELVREIPTETTIAV